MISRKKKILKRKKRNPYFTKQVRYVDYKDVELLKKFINTHGRIIPARVSGLNALQQRAMSRAIKRARHMALLPFVKERIRK